MRRKGVIVTVVLVLLLEAILSGCAPKGEGSGNPEGSGTVLERTWTLKVDQTIPVKEGDVTVNHTLVLIAQKKGGKDIYGTYEGAAYIGSHLDLSPLAKILVKLSGGYDIDIFANNLSFEIEPFDLDRYSSYGSKDKASLAPLVQYDFMALLSPEMKGGIILNPTVKGIDGTQASYEASGGGTAPVPMKIAIKSGKVHVNIPTIVSETFEGEITSDIGISDEVYQEVMKRIEELIKEADEETAKQENEDNTEENLTDLNHIPWPDELAPNIPRASDLVNEVYDWRDEDGYIEIKIYMSKEEAEDYFSKLKDLGISKRGAYMSGDDLCLDGEGEDFELMCAYFTESGFLRISYYYKNY